MSIVITGASGNLGRLVAAAVLDGVDPSEVVLLTRDPSRLGDLARRGAEVRTADFMDPSTLPDAFAGAEKVLVISTDQIGARVPGHKAAIDAAVAAGARSIAYTSGINPSHSNPIVVATDHRETEEHLRRSGAAWTMLRNSIYAEVLLGGAGAALATGRHVTNEGDGRVSYVAREDCAAVAAAVLTSDGHDHKIYDVTGPAALGAADVAALYGELGGRPVDVVAVDDAAYTAGLVEHAGMPEPVAQAYATFGIGTRCGYSAAVSDAVLTIAGKAPRTARDVLAEHRESLASGA
ncbi:MAG TPA: NAD(P)H-binding protein [Solirubrobacteraceae bacterium]|nr:NAD(P)H-binding protein [Solirubrobacteraceae bacterium]